MFVGFSPVHSSGAPFILNLRTGHISPQYHVVFDDDFSTVSSIGENDEPPSWWNELDLEENRLRIPLNENDKTQLDKDWLSPEELEERSRQEIRNRHLRQAISQPSPDTSLPQSPSMQENDTPSTPPAPTTPSPEPVLPPQPNPKETINPPPPPVIEPPATPTPAPSQSPHVRRSPRLHKASSPAVPSPKPPDWRSTRSTRGARQSARFHDEVFLASVHDPLEASSTNALLAYSVERETDLNTGEINCVDPRAYAAKFKLYNEDNPSYQMAMSSEMAHE